MVQIEHFNDHFNKKTSELCPSKVLQNYLRDWCQNSKNHVEKVENGLRMA